MDKTEKQVKELKAAALRYLPGEDEAPRLVAWGSGLTAHRMIELARDAGVPIRQQNEQLLDVMGKMNRGQVIPSELYHVMAHILAFIELHEKETR